MRTILLRLFALIGLAGLAAVGCGTGTAASGGKTVQVTVGYQSKTISTVNAGTLLRALGLFEQRLAEIGRRTGTRYQVTWQDYEAGAPITTQMLAGKVDIGSMGDYPLLVNGSKTREFADARTELVAITGYNLRGALNMVLVPPSSPARRLGDLAGKKISTSFSSTAHGMLVRALAQAGLAPGSVQLVHHPPSVGASALQSGGVDALSQFAAWPGLLVHRGQARVLYDGADVNQPSLLGIVVRKAYTQEHPEVTEAFLAAVIDATRYLHEHPLQAAQTVAQATGLPPEVVYLYNGPNGLVTFDPTIKPVLREALERDIPFLKSLGALQDLDLDQFVNDSYLRKAYGAAYDTEARSTVNPGRITGTDPLSHRPVDDPATASEAWFDGEGATVPAANPTWLLRLLKASGGKKLRAAYVPDAATGTRWFADKAVWVDDPAAGPDAHLLPFTTLAGAQRYIDAHPGARVVDYATALKAA
ncbi:ABC transporter substrate-binding protein [Carbonactinospora thermoautotrophica]|uniref:ABC transporter substrate-binding protein n=1 Tax=Carbonactinospora thermoautotrophica TaxID=1469144 RepID=UPI0022711FCD|nr:ABC transporter substrate-binding protein [Carbonactinospora thermoautotrophica]MCX9190053.1 ABC transporter substrate-binding protein [Carbonactinospora thermoautotrophica]